MTDRFLDRAWWFTTLSLIAFTSIGSLLCAYRGVFQTFAGAYTSGSIFLILCIPLGAAACLLCKHRGDLVCE